MSKVIGSIVGVAFTVVGFAIAGPLGAVIGSLVGGVVSNALAGKLKDSRQASETTVKVGEGPRVAIFGKAATAGSLVDAFNYGGSNGTDWEVMVFALADHRCDSLVEFYVNDKIVSFSGDGNVSGYNNQLQIFWRDGQSTQTPPSILTTYGGWSSNDQLRGVSYVTAAYKADKSDAKNPIWSGRPSFLFVVKGLRCYDPRKDSTVSGGSGTHRWSNPSTREWTDNAEICRYNFDRGIYACDRVANPHDLLIGRGLTATEAPPENIFAAANICDESVALAAGGSEKRYRANGVVGADEEYGDIVEAFAVAMGGIVTQPQGGIGVEPGHAKSPMAYFTDDDLIVGAAVQFSELRNDVDDEWLNTVVPRYVEPTQKWGDHTAPVRRNTSDIIADGGPREQTLSMRLVTSGTQAQRIAEIRRRQCRLLEHGSVVLGPEFAEIEEGDWVVWTSARRTGGSPITFRVESFSQDQKWQTALSLRRIETSVYSWSTTDEIANGATANSQTPPAAHGQPPAGNWTLSGVQLATGDSRIPAIQFDGGVTDAYATGVLFQYRKVGVSAWTDQPISPPTVAKHIISTVDGGQSYEGAVTYFYDDGRGDQRILGPVTSGALYISVAVNNVNLVRNSEFPFALKGWTYGVSGTGSVVDAGSPQFGNASGASYFKVSGTFTAVALSYVALYQPVDYYMPVTPGQRYAVQALIGSAGIAGTTGYLYVNWIDASGTFLTGADAFTIVQTFTGAQAFPTVAQGFVTAPAGSARARLVWQQYTNGTAGTLALTLAHPMMSTATRDQTDFPPYNPGTTDGADGVSPIAVTVTPQNITVQLNADGSVKTGQLPLDIAVTARQGGATIALTSITLNSPTPAGAWSENDVKVTLGSGFTGTDGFTTITVVAGGQTFSNIPITVGTVRDGATGGTSLNLAVTPTLSLANGASYTQVGTTLAIAASSSGKLKLSLSGVIKTNTVGYGFDYQLDYSTNGGTSWSNAVTGSSSLTDLVGIGDGGGAVAHIGAMVDASGQPVTVTGLGAGTACLVRVTIRKTSTTTAAGATGFSGTLTMYAEQVA